MYDTKCGMHYLECCCTIHESPHFLISIRKYFDKKIQISIYNSTLEKTVSIPY